MEDAASAAARAMPKSMTLTSPSRVSITLAGLMSRCTMPAACETARAAQTSATTSQARCGSSRPLVQQHVSQGPPLQQLHDDVGNAGVVLAGVEDRDDGRGVQRRGGLRLASEAGLERRVAGEVRAEHLDCDVPAEPDVDAPEHLRHAAGADRGPDLVPAAEQDRAPGSGHPPPRPLPPALLDPLSEPLSEPLPEPLSALPPAAGAGTTCPGCSVTGWGVVAGAARPEPRVRAPPR
jgi:hypothetical protein